MAIYRKPVKRGGWNPYTGHPYRGWKSTKLHLSLITMALVFGGFAFTGFKPEAFEWFVIGLLGASGIYSGGNVFEKVKARVGAAPAPPPPPPEEPGPL